MSLRIYYEKDMLLGVAIFQEGKQRFIFHMVDKVYVGHTHTVDTPYSDSLFLATLFELVGLTRP